MGHLEFLDYLEKKFYNINYQVNLIAKLNCAIKVWWPEQGEINVFYKHKICPLQISQLDR